MTLTAARSAAPATPAGAAPVAFTASWPAIAAWGAGLVTAAMGAGGLTAAGGTVAARGIGGALFVVGLASLAWGAVALTGGRTPAPRAVIAGSLAAVMLAGALVIAQPAHTSVFSAAVAIGFALVVGGYAAAALRRPRPTRGVSVWGLLLAAAVLSAAVTPAVGATQDAVLIRDDGSVPVVTHDGH